MQASAKLIGAEIQLEGNYPGWQYKQNSPIREIFKKVYIDMYEEKPKITATHCGLECGVFEKKLGNIDIISFGPDIYDAHTPKERLSTSSAKRTWELLLNVLKEIKQTRQKGLGYNAAEELDSMVRRRIEERKGRNSGIED